MLVIVFLFFFFFFFSSRRRHTRCSRDWSSDVCSSDLIAFVYVANSRLYLRSLSDLQSKAIPGTEFKESIFEPVFSPDDQWIAFYTRSEERRVGKECRYRWSPEQ